MTTHLPTSAIRELIKIISVNMWNIQHYHSIMYEDWFLSGMPSPGWQAPGDLLRFIVKFVGDKAATDVMDKTTLAFIEYMEAKTMISMSPLKKLMKVVNDESQRDESRRRAWEAKVDFVKTLPEEVQQAASSAGTAVIQSNNMYKIEHLCRAMLHLELDESRSIRDILRMMESAFVFEHPNENDFMNEYLRNLT